MCVKPGCNPLERRGSARSYLCYLLFTLKTHSSVTTGLGNESAAVEQETPALSLSAALLTLSGITVVVAVCSECARFSDPVTHFQNFWYISVTIKAISHG